MPNGQCPNVPALIHPSGKDCWCVPLVVGGSCDCVDSGGASGGGGTGGSGGGGSGGGGSGGSGGGGGGEDHPPNMCQAGTKNCVSMTEYADDACTTPKYGDHSGGTIQLDSCLDKSDSTEQRSLRYYLQKSSGSDGEASNAIAFKAFKTNDCSGASTSGTVIGMSFQCDGTCQALTFLPSASPEMNYKCSFCVEGCAGAGPGKTGLGAGAVVGIVLGALVGVAALAVAGFFVVRFVRKRKENNVGLLSLAGGGDGGGEGYHQI